MEKAKRHVNPGLGDAMKRPSAKIKIHSKRGR